MNILHRVQILEQRMQRAVSLQRRACKAQDEAKLAMLEAECGLALLIEGTTITRKGMTPTTDEEREKLRKAQAIVVPVKTKAKSFGGALKQYAVEHGVKREDANGNTYHEVPASDLIIT
jgi:hypothetical protein